MNNNYTINGYLVRHCYAGIDQYTVFDGDKEIGTCWSISALAKMVGVDAETVNEEIWKQMFAKTVQGA